MSSWSPAAANSIGGLGGDPGRLADEHAAGRCDRLEPGRGVDEVAGDHPLSFGPDRDRGLTGQHADPDREVDAGLAPKGRDHVDELEGRPDRALGVVLVGDRGAPQRHHGVADELLDGAAVAVDDHPGPLEIPVLEVAHRLRVAARGQRREPDQVGEQDRHDASLGGTPAPRVAGVARPLTGAARSAVAAPGSSRSVPQNFAPGRIAAPHTGQAPRALPALEAEAASGRGCWFRSSGRSRCMESTRAVASRAAWRSAQAGRKAA